jgi:hypothetical protein
MDGMMSIEELYEMPIKDLNLLIQSVEAQQQINNMKSK